MNEELDILETIHSQQRIWNADCEMVEALYAEISRLRFR